MSDDKIYVTGRDMLCPVCNHGLVPMDKKPYETLVEHGFTPNDTPSMKIGYGCHDHTCDAFGARWLEDGEGYFGTPSKPLPKGAYYPKGTWHYEYDKEHSK